MLIKHWIMNVQVKTDYLYQQGSFSLIKAPRKDPDCLDDINETQWYPTLNFVSFT